MPEYKQCTTIGTFDSNTIEFLYFFFVMIMSLILPLIIMVGSYFTIVRVIFRLLPTENLYDNDLRKAKIIRSKTDFKSFKNVSNHEPF